MSLGLQNNSLCWYMHTFLKRLVARILIHVHRKWCLVYGGDFHFILYCELIFFSCYKTIGKIRENIGFCKDVYFKEKGCYSR